MTLLATVVFANQKTVSVVLSHAGAPYKRFVEGIRSVVSQSGTDCRIRVVDIRDVNDSQLKSSDLIITGGVNAMRITQRLRGPVMIHALIPAGSPATSDTAGESGRKSIYIYLDQPAVRVMRLIRVAFAGVKRVGMILGKTHSADVTGLQQAASGEQLSLVVRLINSSSEIFPVLRELVGQVDVFLLLPDKVVIKPSTIQAILLSTYHSGIPLLAYSPAFVRVGAVLSLHITPYQAGVQAGEMLVRVVEGRIDRYPVKVRAAYYELKINSRVAESLGISLPSVHDLKKAMIKR
jgi:ABC-type uncharacterized transport system substrate-binding protein